MQKNMHKQQENHEKNNQTAVLDVRDVPKIHQWLTLSLQHLFAMFGATVLVPFLVKLDPGVALVSSGLATLAYLLVTKGQIPAYLGSSFAFISPIIAVKALGGPEAAMLGSFLAGLVYGAVALIIKTSGLKWLMRIMPPVVVGPVIIVIGLGLANTAVGMAMNDPATKAYSLSHFTVALFTLAVTIVCSMYFKGILGIIPILIGIISGYLFALSRGMVDLSGVKAASWFDTPEFMFPFVSYTPHFTWSIALIMMPVATVTIAEHIGHQLVLSKVVGRNFLEKPGLHRSILGDGIGVMIGSLIGGPPVTTYGENIGVLAITRVFSVFVIGGAAVAAICFGFSGKVTALISSVPSPVMGGVSILLFGIIASSGLRMLIDNQIDFGNKRNLIIASVILVTGIGGAVLQFTETLQLAGMALATLIGVFLNLVLPGRENDSELLNKMFGVSDNDPAA
ncbi:solute carrier family 23 protein [Fictibacillus enclensis]|nr:solute carrier family 23 protein [Fictibacillus enclensis]MDM5198800.1 solute carrier family 23 protein [Fictibacillus enclensis]WHY74356.1 solute carrier family 23 protein [Fictibacillus enclensis]